MSPIDVVERARGLLRDIENEPGGALCSGWDTIRPGSLYVMGFNPGGHTAGSKAIVGTIGQSLLNELLDWSDYTDVSAECPQTLFQKHTLGALTALGGDPKRTFSTNAVFARSNVMNTLDGAWNLWWRHCWAVHQLFLHVVRPRVILCLGNGNIESPWAMLRLPRPPIGKTYTPIWPMQETSKFRDGRIQSRVCLDLGEYGTHCCTIVGLPHPSRWGQNPACKQKLALARSCMGEECSWGAR